MVDLFRWMTFILPVAIIIGCFRVLRGHDERRLLVSGILLWAVNSALFAGYALLSSTYGLLTDFPQNFGVAWSQVLRIHGFFMVGAGIVSLILADRKAKRQ